MRPVIWRATGGTTPGILQMFRWFKMGKVKATGGLWSRSAIDRDHAKRTFSTEPIIRHRLTGMPRSGHSEGLVGVGTGKALRVESVTQTWWLGC